MKFININCNYFPEKFIRDDNDEDEEEEQDENMEDEGDEILNLSDIMHRDESFVATPIDGKWYYLFPGIITQDEDNEDLDGKQILDVINRRRQSKYKILESKIWIFQADCKKNWI